MLASNSSNQNFPAYFEILDEEDREKYKKLKYYIANSGKKYKRYQRVESLKDALHWAYCYCIKHDSNDWKRCLICGIFWTDLDTIIINNHQLQILIDKCKSSINDAILRMGYKTIPFTSCEETKLMYNNPFLSEKSIEWKNWTVRKKLLFPHIYFQNNYNHLIEKCY